MGKGGKKYTIGYRYFVGMHMVCCHGPVDAVLKIRAGDEDIHATAVNASGSLYINKPNIFGGEKKEGGIQGYVDVAFGEATQTANPYLAARLGADRTPGYRGVLSFILRQVYVAAMNPYIKPWSFYVRRTAGAAIGTDMNPAAIIEECLTNGEWGMGYPSGDLDGASFAAARTALAAEGLGLSLLWDRSATIEDFIAEVLRHIEGVLFTDIFTGKFVLRLVRQDYAPAQLPVLDASNLIEVQSYARRSQAELVNTLILNYTDGPTNQEQAITLHNMGLLQAQGQIIAHEVTYPGVTNGQVANMLAARDLRNLSAELSTLVATGNRSLIGLRLGDAFRFRWPEYGVTDEILRVSKIDYGDLTDGRITIHATQDIHGVAVASYAAPPATGWVNPVSLPAAAPYRRLFEAPYWDLVQVFGESPTVWAELDALLGRLRLCAAKPSSDALNYILKTTSGGAFADHGSGEFTPTAQLAEAIGKTVVGVTLYGGLDLDLVEPGSYALLGDELVEIVALNTATETATLKRGVLDTVPAAHAAGARLWFAGHWAASDEVDYYQPEAVQTKALTVTSRGTLAEASAPADSLAFAARMIRPYPPGRFRINGAVYPATISGALSMAWAHRHRLQQTAYFVAQDETDIGPEPGTTYRLRIYGENNTLLRTVSGIAGTAYGYAMADEIADSGLGRPNERLRVLLDSQRDGFHSWQAQEHTLEECRGYGMFYGAYYGE